MNNQTNYDSEVQQGKSLELLPNLDASLFEGDLDRARVFNPGCPGTGRIATPQEVGIYLRHRFQKFIKE